VTSARTEHRNVLPIEDTESYRWLQSLKNAWPGRGNTRLVTVCDRGADIDELFQLSAQRAAPVLGRAHYERPINKRSMYAGKDIVKLWEPLKHQPCAGGSAREIPARRGTNQATPRAPRVATVERRFASFTLTPPKRLSSTLPNLAMSAIYVRETAPPADEPPLEWMLLPNLPIENFDQA
jgi:hypothetical protein